MKTKSATEKILLFKIAHKLNASKGELEKFANCCVGLAI
jgi:hypothetical protein